MRLCQNMSSARRTTSLIINKNYNIIAIIVTLIIICHVMMGNKCAAIDDIESVTTAIIECETNKECDKKMECHNNQCLDACRKNPCGENALCKVKNNLCLMACKCYD